MQLEAGFLLQEGLIAGRYGFFAFPQLIQTQLVMGRKLLGFLAQDTRYHDERRRRDKEEAMFSNPINPQDM